MMMGSYFKSAVRAVIRDRFHAAINIVGLSVALAAALLIGVYVRHELSYESFIPDADSVYRVEADYTLPGQTMDRWSLSPHPVPELLEADYGDQLTATFLAERDLVLTVDGEPFRRIVTVADANFFDVIGLPVARGDTAAFREPNSLILSRSAAIQMFGTDDVVGRTVGVDGPQDVPDQRVVAVLADLPSNTRFRFDILGTTESGRPFAFPPEMSANWGNVVQETYVRLHDGVRPDAIAGQMPAFVARHMPESFSFTVGLNLRPLRRLHLADSPDAKLSNRNAVALAALTATGAFLIFIACFSYINLATARSLLRIKEVGLRKIMGGRTRHLAFQFLAESVVITTLSFVIGAVLAALLAPVFAGLVDRDLRLADMAEPGYLALAAGLIVLVSMGAGAYPALVLASRRPIVLFRGKRGAVGGGGLLRTGIVSLQFGMTTALMITAVVVFAQISYLRNIDLGFDETNLLIVRYPPVPVDLTSTEESRQQVFRERLEQSPSIEAVAGGGSTPVPAYELYTPMSRPGDPPGADQAVLSISVSRRFFEVYDVPPLAGRAFSEDPTRDVLRNPTPDQPNGEGPLVVTQSFLSMFDLGAPEAALGEHIVVNTRGGAQMDFTIIGIVPDMHFRLGRQEKMPMAFIPAQSPDLGEVTARVRPGAADGALADARRIWAELFPEEQMNYEFLDDRIAAANADDQRQSSLFAFFAVLALFVACLGLFALSSFVVARRTYEVAVRKTLGASTANVSRLLMWDFAKPVLLANVIAWPIAWLLAHAWLGRFPERIDLSPGFFLGVSAVALVVAMLTIFARTLRSAGVHPASVLKYE